MPTNKSKMGEILHKRTRNSKTWMNFDGSYTTEIHGGDVHYDDEEGNFHNINTDLLDEADADLMDEPCAKEGAFDFKVAQRTVKQLKKEGQLNRDNWDFQAPKVPFDAKIPRRFQRGYSIGKGKDKLTFVPVDSSPASGHADKNCVEYQDVWNDADVCLEVKPNGVKETITLKTDRAPSSFRFEVKGNIDALEELKLEPAWLVDADGTEKDVSQEIVSENGKQYVDLTADVTDLVYPITIDPTVTISNDGALGRYVDDSGSSDDELHVGTYMLNGEPRHYRSLIKFPEISSLPSEAFINNAKLSLYIYQPNANTADQYAAMHANLSDFDSTADWTTKPSVTNTSSDDVLLDNRNKWYDWDVTDITQYWIDQNNYGLTLIGEETDNTQNQQSFSDFTFTSNAPVLEVNYNTPPAPPTLTTPNGGETWNAEHTITHTASSDDDGDSLTYQVQLSTDNGSTWGTILNGVSGTSHTYDFTNEPETSTARIRVRAYDGTSYSDWDQSDGVFTINHNNAPDTPSNLSPSGGEPIDQNTTQRMSWQHNDDPGDGQSKYDLQWRQTGASTWNGETGSTSNNYWDAPAGTFPNGDIEWRVKTYDQEDVASPWSNIETFFVGNRPSAPSIIYPGSEDVPVSNPTIEWSSSGQVSYDLRIFYDDVFDTYQQVYQHTGATNKAHTIDFDLQNQTNYELRLSITNSDGLTSQDTATDFFISYTAPAKAELELITNNATGTITVNPTFPEPSGTEPTVTSYDVYRRPNGGEWIRIAKDLDPDSDYVDFTPASNQVYEYYVRSHGDNETIRDSGVVTDSITLATAQLLRVSTPTEYVILDKVTGASQNKSVGRSMKQFAGRSKPVAYFNESTSLSIDTSFLIQGDDNMQALSDLSLSREILLYRDERGRKAFITLAGVEEEDVVGNTYYRVSLNPVEVDYDEET